MRYNWTKSQQSLPVIQGRARLMLRQPAMREVLRNISDPSLNELFEIYEVASSALERFRAYGSAEDKLLIPEYETYCTEIEQDVLKDVMDLQRSRESEAVR